MCETASPEGSLCEKSRLAPYGPYPNLSAVPVWQADRGDLLRGDSIRAYHLGISSMVSCSTSTTRDVEAFFEKTAIACHLSSRKSTRFWRHAIAVFFKNSSTTRVPVPYSYRDHGLVRSAD